MREHPVLVPTAVGTAGGVVAEPDGEPRGALVLLQGLGPSARAGVNAVWTHVARDLAALGLTVLRFDFACEGDSTLAGWEAPREVGWRRSTDLAMLRDVAPWFLERSGERELLLAGACHGARVGLEFAAHDPAARELFLVVPYLTFREPHLRETPPEELPGGAEPVWANGPTLNSEEEIVAGFRAALSRAPAWVLVGGEEAAEVEPYARRLRDGERPLELEVAGDIPELHPVGHPEQQATVRRRLVDRVAAALAAREPAASPAP